MPNYAASRATAWSAPRTSAAARMASAASAILSAAKVARAAHAVNLSRVATEPAAQHAPTTCAAAR
jgi:hypothetical protein